MNGTLAKHVLSEVFASLYSSLLPRPAGWKRDSGAAVHASSGASRADIPLRPVQFEQSKTVASVSQASSSQEFGTTPARFVSSAMATGVTSRQQNTVASLSTPGSRTTSSGHPRRFVVPGSTSTLLSRRFMASLEMTTTGRDFVPICVHQISPRSGCAPVMSRCPDRPNRFLLRY
jgi:hypothetical protein